MAHYSNAKSTNCPSTAAAFAKTLLAGYILPFLTLKGIWTILVKIAQDLKLLYIYIYKTADVSMLTGESFLTVLLIHRKKKSGYIYAFLNSYISVSKLMSHRLTIVVG